jgi:sporulation protein YlmC with PRC-barrel domain
LVEINIGAMLESNGREVGRVESVVLDSALYEATHLVIKLGGPLSTRHVLMPVNWVTRSEHDRIQINHWEDELTALSNFEMQHYARLDQLEQEHLEHPRSKIKPADWINYFVPLVAKSLGEPYTPPGVVVTDQLLSPSERTIKRGLPVESNDGYKLGEVHELLLSEPDWRLSGVIIARGFVLKHPMRVPADWVAKIERERIILNRSKQQVEDWEKK